MIDRTAQRARELFESGFYCAESVLMAVAEAYGIESDLIPKIATGFCAGIARTCGLCGAVSGAIMGIDLLTGRTSKETSPDANYALVRALLDEFRGRFSSTNCAELLGCDLGTAEGQAFFKDNRLRERCAEYTGEAARIAMALLAEKRQ